MFSIKKMEELGAGLQQLCGARVMGCVLRSWVSVLGGFVVGVRRAGMLGCFAVSVCV